MLVTNIMPMTIRLFVKL